MDGQSVRMGKRITREGPALPHELLWRSLGDFFLDRCERGRQVCDQRAKVQGRSMWSFSTANVQTLDHASERLEGGLHCSMSARRQAVSWQLHEHDVLVVCKSHEADPPGLCRMTTSASGPRLLAPALEESSSGSRGLS